VWETLPTLFGDDVELAAEPGGRLRATEAGCVRVGVVEEADAPRRLAFWWTPAGGGTDDGAASMVEVELTPLESTGSAVGTLLRVRETRFDAAGVLDSLLRGPLAGARA
jgi:hypothetical protein